ncbi:hypothetical protein MYX65_00095 [Acidobacteria bacterium AH-259-L09]|nr:hypothetical protein [Acidobacteria bacterium AH-259-L09]
MKVDSSREPVDVVDRSPTQRLESIFFSSMLEVKTNVVIPPGFRYGSGSFAKRKALKVLPNRAVCYFLRASEDAEALERKWETVSFGGIRGNTDQDRVLIARPLGNGKRATVSLSGLWSGTPTVTFNRLYDYWSNLRYVKLDRPVRHLGSLVEASLLQKGVVPMHAGCFMRDGYAHLVLAPPDTGKSRSVIELVKAGWEYGAEDLVLIKDKDVYPVPFTTTVGQWTGHALRTRLLRLFWRSTTDKQTVYESLGIPPAPLAPSYKMGNLYLLIRSPSSSVVRVAERSNVMRQVLMWNRMELAYYQDRLLTALLTLNEGLPTLDELMAEERRNLNQVLREAAHVCVVRANDAREFPRLIEGTLP